MFKSLILALVVSLLSAPAFAAADNYKMIKEKSSLKFFANNNNAPVEGQFKDFLADIKFDHEKPEDSKISVVVDIKSIAANADKLAETLLGKDWFSADVFPKAVFTSTKITRMPSSENYYGEGTLKIRDKTVPVNINFSLQFADADNAIAKGYVTLRRNDFGIGQGSFAKDDALKNEVRVEFRVAAQK